MDLSGTSWISEMGLEDPNLSEQYDILDFFDEELSAAIANIGGTEDQQQDIQNTWSQDFNSSSSNTMLIPRTDSTTSICTSSFFLDSQNIAASVASAASVAAGLEETPFAPQYCHINFIDNNLNGENNNNHHVTPSPSVLVFGNSNKTPQSTAEEVLISSSGSYVNLEELAAKKAQSTTKKTPRTRPPSQTYDHIIAERKRRELLSQQFVALSAIVPGLKKMDKTSVLGDAINYLKELKEKVDTLEEKTSKQKMESMVLVKKTQVMIEDDDDDDENSNSNSNSNSKPKSNSNSNSDEGSYDEQHLPEIEAKMCDKKLLIRIQCEKNRGVLGKIFTEIQKLNMAVINTNATPFGNMALDITIVAQVDKEFNVTMKELVRSLRSAILLE